MRDFYVGLILLAGLYLVQWVSLFNFKVTVLARLKELHGLVDDCYRGIEHARSVLHAVDNRTGDIDDWANKVHARMTAIGEDLVRAGRRPPRVIKVYSGIRPRRRPRPTSRR